MHSIRKLIQIDEEKCTGCGLCVPGCEEGALQIIDGKARLMSEVYCDGLGACLGHCPEGALTVIEARAADFDPDAVREHLAGQGRQAPDHMPSPEELRIAPDPEAACPGTALGRPAPEALKAVGCKAANASAFQASTVSNLGHWPVQIRLASPDAPFLRGAELLLTADCVPVALPGFHQMIRGKAVLLGCPKFDDAEAYVQKLADIFRLSGPSGVVILEMEVPCCSNFSRIARAARQLAGVHVPMERRVVARSGELLGVETLAEAGPDLG